jgi:hypothetical protein
MPADAAELADTESEEDAEPALPDESATIENAGSSNRNTTE